jgi:hypothetical protein
MPGQVLIKGYQIGYRFKGIGGYTGPYTDLPMHRVDDYGKFESIVSAVNAQNAAQALLDKMRADFEDVGATEWRIVEVWE